MTACSPKCAVRCWRASAGKPGPGSLHPQGHIDIERLITRLDALMRYDYAEDAGNAANEYGFLLSELKRAFPKRLHEARKGDIHGEELKRFAKFCETNGCCCITFNYDDFLDEALAQTGSWNPYWGYGFFCPSSLDTIASFDELEKHSVLRLLKLHGSIDWRPKLGYGLAAFGDAFAGTPYAGFRADRADRDRERAEDAT